MDLRFGIVTGQARPFATILEDWLLIEELGFDNAWLIDHFSPDFHPNGPWLEAWTTLAALAARTSRIRIGTAVTNAAVRNPSVLCKQAITVDQVSGGRLEMGVGAGFYESEHRMLGVDYLDPRGRSERLREAVEVLDTGLRGERVVRNYLKVSSRNQVIQRLRGFLLIEGVLLDQRSAARAAKEMVCGATEWQPCDAGEVAPAARGRV